MSNDTKKRDGFQKGLDIYDRGLATITALGVIGGGIVAIVNYYIAKNNEIIQREKERETRQYELDLQAFKDQKEAYLALCDAACEIAACNTKKEVEEKLPAFTKVYLGRAHLFLLGTYHGKEIQRVKIGLHNEIMKYLKEDTTDTPFFRFGTLALELTEACHLAIGPNEAPISRIKTK